MKLNIFSHGFSLHLESTACMVWQSITASVWLDGLKTYFLAHMDAATSFPETVLGSHSPCLIVSGFLILL
jgi:hypothetical protein